MRILQWNTQQKWLLKVHLGCIHIFRIVALLKRERITLVPKVKHPVACFRRTSSWWWVLGECCELTTLCSHLCTHLGHLRGGLDFLNTPLFCSNYSGLWDWHENAHIYGSQNLICLMLSIRQWHENRAFLKCASWLRPVQCLFFDACDVN